MASPASISVATERGLAQLLATVLGRESSVCGCAIAQRSTKMTSGHEVVREGNARAASRDLTGCYNVDINATAHNIHTGPPAPHPAFDRGASCFAGV
jgi:hypothetical protein